MLTLQAVQRLQQNFLKTGRTLVTSAKRQHTALRKRVLNQKISASLTQYRGTKIGSILRVCSTQKQLADGVIKNTAFGVVLVFHRAQPRELLQI